jgi:hypothetical protein
MHPQRSVAPRTTPLVWKSAPQHILAALALSAGGLLAACATEPSVAEQHEDDRGSILVTVTVDWEGRDLSEANLAAMEQLRSRFPDVPLVHYLNAAYFTKPDVDEELVRAQIGRPLRERDELGLHLHGWKRLFEAADVPFRASPTFWDPNGVVTDCAFDCGHEVPISAYSHEELERVIAFSLAKLDEHGLGRAVSFRAGGWMAEDNVRRALVAQGIETDSSAVPTQFLQSELGTLPLYGWLDALWAGTTSRSQPHEIETESGLLFEIPDNGALADYVLGDEMVAVFDAARSTLEASPSADVVVSIGFHQETAAKYLPRLEQALDTIVRRARDEALPIRFVTARELLARRE